MRKDLVKRIVVRAPNWIGDAVMCTPALLALRDVFPFSEITLLARPPVADLLTGHPSVDRILVYEHQGRHAGVLGKIALIRTLQRNGFDFAVLLQNAFEAALWMYLAGVPERYGYSTDGRGFLLSRSIPKPPHTHDLHQVWYYQALIQALDRDVPSYAPTLVVSEHEEARVSEKLTRFSIKDSDVLIGVNPGSMYGGAKRWLPERFAETADRLVEELGSRPSTNGKVYCVIVGAPGEEGLGRSIAERMRTKPVVLSGQTSLRELMALIKRCRLFLTNDTGPMHIASAFGVPLVAVFGPTDPRTTAPFGEGHTLVRHPVNCSPCLLRECPIDHRCMTKISVEEVYHAAVQHLGENFVRS